MYEASQIETQGGTEALCKAHGRGIAAMRPCLIRQSTGGLIGLEILRSFASAAAMLLIFRVVVFHVPSQRTDVAR